MLAWDVERLGPLPSGCSTAAEPHSPATHLDDDALAAIYRRGQPAVRANMVSTLDGAGVDAGGRSGGINTPSDHRVFGLLRALSHAVIVGAGTIRAERYTRIPIDPPWWPLRRELGLSRPPTLVVPTSSGDLPESVLAPLPEGGDLLVLADPSVPPARRDELAERLGPSAVVSLPEVGQPGAMIQLLTDRGFNHILCEGGPSLLRELVAAGLVDELCLTTSPLLTGGHAGRILRGPQLRQGAHLLTVLEDAGTLLARWRLPEPGR